MHILIVFLLLVLLFGFNRVAAFVWWTVLGATEEGQVKYWTHAGKESLAKERRCERAPFTLLLGPIRAFALLLLRKAKMAEPPNLKLTAVFEPCEGGGFHAFIRAFPGIPPQGETIDETEANLTDTLGYYLLDGLEDNLSGLKVTDRVEVELQILVGLQDANAIKNLGRPFDRNRESPTPGGQTFSSPRIPPVVKSVSYGPRAT